MREIKFRAWEKKTDYLPNGAGTMHQSDDMFTDYLIGFDGDIYEKFVDSFAGESFDNYRDVTDQFILMQYTGLKDKNEKDIYENDFVAIDIWQGNEHGYIPEDGVIKWHELSSAFKWFSFEEDSSDSHNYWLSQADTKQREVIGNIYENPELLK